MDDDLSNRSTRRSDVKTWRTDRFACTHALGHATHAAQSACARGAQPMHSRDGARWDDLGAKGVRE